MGTKRKYVVFCLCRKALFSPWRLHSFKSLMNYDSLVVRKLPCIGLVYTVIFSCLSVKHFFHNTILSLKILRKYLVNTVINWRKQRENKSKMTSNSLFLFILCSKFKLSSVPVLCSKLLLYDSFGFLFTC